MKRILWVCGEECLFNLTESSLYTHSVISVVTKLFGFVNIETLDLLRNDGAFIQG